LFKIDRAQSVDARCKMQEADSFKLHVAIKMRILLHPTSLVVINYILPSDINTLLQLNQREDPMLDSAF
jgi:hypothetical protein